MITLSDVNDAIDRLRELKPNWDSYGADPVEHESIRWAKLRVKQLISCGVNAPAVAATPSGLVTLRWGDANSDFEIEVATDGKMHIVGETRGVFGLAHLLLQFNDG